MKKMQKVLSVLLCLCMVLSYVPVTAFAAESPVESVQALVDALPEEVTAENIDAVKEQLSVIDQAKLELSDEEMLQVETPMIQLLLVSFMVVIHRKKSLFLLLLLQINMHLQQ